MPDIDLLQIRIEKAKMALSDETRRAIDGVDWHQALVDIRAKKGFSLEKMEALELETELMLCGLLNPADYEKEIRERMGISPTEAKEVVSDMNDRVFKKIREEFAKILALKKVETPEPKALVEEDTSVLKEAGIEVVIKENKTEEQSAPKEGREEMLKDVERPELINVETKKTEIENFLPEIMAPKLAGEFKMAPVKTEYTIANIAKSAPTTKEVPGAKLPKVDPYREPPE
jgi:hypothetical protein